MAARLCGADVAMVARVGDDLFGPATIKNFESQGIDASHVRVVAGASSGVAPIFVESNGQNRIIVVKGANDRLLPADVDAAGPLLEAADCIVLQFEIPLETVFHTVRVARERGIRCIVNPAPAQPFDLAALAGVDYFVPNETEAETITGMPVRSVDDAKSMRGALGGPGTAAGDHHPRGQGRPAGVAAAATELVAPYRVATKDTTGAGDAFVGSFAVFLGEGLSERDAIARANLYAALSTTGVGTQKSFVDRQRFDAEWQARAAAEPRASS